MKHILFYFLFLTSHVLSQPEKADFFIAADLSDFEILNRYQQKLSASDKQQLKKYTPWKIRAENTLLSDQITHVMQVEREGVLYYFVLNSDGAFKNDPQTFYEKFHDCFMVNDRVNVSWDEAVLFSEIPFSSKSDHPRYYLEKGTKLVRLFKKGPSYFAKDLQRDLFGWIRFNTNSAITIITDEGEELEQSEFDEKLLVQVENKVSAVNSVYRELFNYLNSEYNQDRNAPVWQMTRSEKNITLNLENMNPLKVKKSTSYLLNDIENIFTGEGVYIRLTGDSIIISLEDEN